MLDRYWGYDFFISYAHADWPLNSGPVDFHLPRALFERLRPHFRVFFDLEEHQLGAVLDEATERRVAMSRQLVLVAGPKAVDSRWVLAEVRAAMQAGRTPIVIDPFGTYERLDRAHALKQAIGERIDLRREGRRDDELTETAVARLARSSEGRSVERSRHRFLKVATGVLAAVTVVALGQSIWASVLGTRTQDRLTWERADRAARMGDHPTALSLLREVQIDDELDGWRSLALTSLLVPTPSATGEGLMIAVDSKRRQAAVWGNRGLVVRSLDRDGGERLLNLPSTWRTVDLVPLVIHDNDATGFSADGRHLLVGFMNGSSGLWDLKAGSHPILSWQHRTARLAPDGTRLLVMPGNDGSGQLELRSLDNPLECQLCESIAIPSRQSLWWTADAVLAVGNTGLLRLAPGKAVALLDAAQWYFGYEVATDGSWFAATTHKKGSATAMLRIVPSAQVRQEPIAELRVPFAVSVHEQFAALNADCALIPVGKGKMHRFRPHFGLDPTFDDPRGSSCSGPWASSSCRAQILPGCQRAILSRSTVRGDRSPPIWLVELDIGDARPIPYPALDRSGMDRNFDPNKAEFVVSSCGRWVAVRTSPSGALLWNVDAASVTPIDDGDGGIHARPGPPPHVERFSSDGRWIYGTSGADGESRIWSVERPDEPIRLPHTSGARLFESGTDEVTTVTRSHWSSWALGTDGRLAGNDVVMFGSLSSDAGMAFLVHHPYGQPVADVRKLDVVDRRLRQIVGVTQVPSGADRLQRLADGTRVLSTGAKLCTVHSIEAKQRAGEALVEPPRTESRVENPVQCRSDDAGSRIVQWQIDRLSVRRGEDWDAPAAVLDLPARAQVRAVAISRSGEFVAGIVRVARKADVRVWRLTSGQPATLVHVVPLEDAAIGQVRDLAIANDGRTLAVIGSRTRMGEPRDILAMTLARGRLARVVELQGHAPERSMPVHIEFDPAGRHVMAHTIAPDKAFVAWDLQQPPWPVLNIDRFPGQLHDVRFGPGPAQISLLYGTGFVRTMSISADGVRQALDNEHRVCVTASQRAAWTRESREEAQSRVEECRSGTTRPWTFARLASMWKGQAWRPN